MKRSLTRRIKGKKVPKDYSPYLIPRAELPKAVKIGTPIKILIGVGGRRVENMR